ncbi:hypothetical protein STENM327S_05553 [Streptomyces tendae]
MRGWLPGEPDPAKAPAPPTGEVTVTGALQAAESPGSNGVSGRSGWPAGQTGAISAATLLNLVPYDVYDAWVTLNEGDSGMRAVPVSAPQNSGLDLKAFQNLGYTAEWFAFVGFVDLMWFRLLRREVELARDAELGLDTRDDANDTDGEGGDPGTGPTGPGRARLLIAAGPHPRGYAPEPESASRPVQYTVPTHALDTVAGAEPEPLCGV